MAFSQTLVAYLWTIHSTPICFGTVVENHCYRKMGGVIRHFQNIASFSREFWFQNFEVEFQNCQISGLLTPFCIDLTRGSSWILIHKGYTYYCGLWHLECFGGVHTTTPGFWPLESAKVYARFLYFYASGHSAMCTYGEVCNRHTGCVYMG